MVGRLPRSIHIAILAAALLCPRPAGAQVLVRQPHCESILVQLQSLLDDVHVYPGDLIDPPYVYRAWTQAPRVDLSQTYPIAILRILDHALTDELRPDAGDWTIELMPAKPVSFDLRLDGGKGRFDLTGMPVQDLALFASFAELQFDFGNSNPVRLETCRITVQSGELQLHDLLNARPAGIVLKLPRTKARIDLTGKPFAGEAELLFQGTAQSVQLRIPHDLPLWIEGPAANLQPFDATASERRDTGLRTPGYESAACRVHLRFEQVIANLSVNWAGAIDLAGVSAPPAPHSAPGPLTPPVVDRETERRVDAVLESIEQHNPGEALARLRELEESASRDPRLPVLRRWLHWFPPTPPLPQTGAPPPAPAPQDEPPPPGMMHLRAGLRFYLLGEYSNALPEFAAARVDPRLASDAEAWMRRTRSEMQRLQPSVTAPPQVVERVVTQGMSPVFALRNPAGGVSTLRGATLQLAGLVGDDTGIDRIEVSVNGQPLLDGTGAKVQVRPAGADSTRRMPFHIPIPLRAGENQIVVTAYDADRPARWTSEQLVVTRLQPLWRTPLALALALGLLFAAAAWAGITRLVKSRIAFVNKYNPYVAGLPVRNAELLFGREPLLQSVLNTIHSNSIMLHGPRRIGKTSLQLELKRRLELSRDPDYHFVPVFVDLQGTVEEHFFSTVMTDILEVARLHVHGQLPAGPDSVAPYTSREFSRDLRATLAALQATTPKKLKVVLLIDEVDQLNRYSEQTNQKLRAVFMKTFAESLVAVMSGTHIEKQWRSEGSPWYNFFEEIEVGKLSRDDAVRLVRTPVQGIFTYDQDAVDRILEYSGCQPYIVQRLCVHAINRIIEAKRRRVRAADIDAVREQAVQVTDEAA